MKTKKSRRIARRILKAYLAERDIHILTFLVDLRINPQTYAAWVAGRFTPRLETALAIQKATGGRVTPEMWITDDEVPS